MVMTAIQNSFTRSLSIPNGMPRPLEILFAVGCLLICSPLLILSGLVLLMTSGSPLLFKQTRVGRRGSTFTMYKLRTMRVDLGGPEVTARGDCRITRIGRLLRRTKLDELPELWNVVRGDMSLVGPRPEVPKYVNFENVLWQEVLQVRPGITDPTTLQLRNEEELLGFIHEDPEQFYLNTLQPYKLQSYIIYLRQRSCRTDFNVLFRTLLVVLLPARAPIPSPDEIVSANSIH